MNKTSNFSDTFPESGEDTIEWIDSLIREKDDGEDDSEDIIDINEVKGPKHVNIFVLLIPYVLLGVATIPIAAYLYEWFAYIFSFSSFLWKITFYIISTFLGAVSVVFCFAFIWLFFAMTKAIIKGK